jgi:hypothetical protein
VAGMHAESLAGIAVLGAVCDVLIVQGTPDSNGRGRGT